MQFYELIRRKRDGEAVDAEELASFLGAYAGGRVSDAQMAAFLMAVCFRGMSGPELAALVEAMLRSGAVLDLDAIEGPKVGKHSTGGVGDKVSIVVAPLVAALGVRVPKISGRGLGHTGGTLDKLEAIPGFRTDLSVERFQRQIAEVGCAIMGQTPEIVPLDRKLYALRDVTATVDSVPLIASSIMCKKLAEGADALVLDVKLGRGGFSLEPERAIVLARTMIEIGAAYGQRTVALVSAMDRPLGHAVGNALEVEEAIFALRGEGPADLREVVLAIATEMLCAGEAAPDAAAGRAAAEAALGDGRALECLGRLISAQGGNPGVVDDPAVLPQAPVRRVLEAERAGYVAEVDARAVGAIAIELGAGRTAPGAAVDPAVGLVVTAKPGRQVERGEPLATICARSVTSADAALKGLRAAIRIDEQTPAPALPLVSHRVTLDGVRELRPGARPV